MPQRPSLRSTAAWLLLVTAMVLVTAAGLSRPHLTGGVETARAPSGGPVRDEAAIRSVAKGWHRLAASVDRYPTGATGAFSRYLTPTLEDSYLTALHARTLRGLVSRPPAHPVGVYRAWG